MEKAEEIYTLPAEFGWSDLGSWDPYITLLLQSKEGNAAVGEEARFYNSKIVA